MLYKDGAGGSPGYSEVIGKTHTSFRGTSAPGFCTQESTRSRQMSVKQQCLCHVPLRKMFPLNSGVPTTKIRKGLEGGSHGV